MKSLIVAAVLSIMGCSEVNQHAQTPMQDRIDSCGVMYDHILDLTLRDRIDPLHALNKEQREYGTKLLDKEFSDSGTKNRFFQFCLYKMTDNGIKCAIKSESVENIDLCRKML